MAFDKYDNLYNKIIKKLNSENIESEGDIINLYDLNNACDESLKKYNFILIDKTPILIKCMNSRSKSNKFPFSKKGYPLLSDIKTYINNENAYVKCIFRENRQNNFVIYSYDENNNVMPVLTNFKNDEENTFLKKNSLELETLLLAAEEFKLDYPSVEYEWSLNDRNIYDFSIKDGIFHSEISLNDPKRSHTGLNSLNDIITATYKHPEYGELYDYIDMYQTDFMKKIAVNVNDLNPFVKNIACNYLAKNNKNVKKLIK